MRGLRRDFADWRRREPVWSVLVLALAVVELVAAVGLRSTNCLAIASWVLLYVSVKLEVSRALRYADTGLSDHLAELLTERLRESQRGQR